MIQNKVLRNIFGTKSDRIAGKWRKLNNAELYALYSPSNIIRTTEMGRTCCTCERIEKRRTKFYKKDLRVRPLETTKRRKLKWI